MNKVQKLIDELVEKYNIRSFIVDNEQWFALRDLPIPRRSLERYKNDIMKIDEGHYNENIKLWRKNELNNIDFTSLKDNKVNNYINFKVKTLNNYGTTFVKLELFIEIVNMSNIDCNFREDLNMLLLKLCDVMAGAGLDLYVNERPMIVGHKQNSFSILRLEKQFGAILKGLLPKVEIIPQYRVLNYRVDFYFPDYNMIVEYDETFHKRQHKEDKERMEKIVNVLKQRYLLKYPGAYDCEITIIRVKEKEEIEGLRQILHRINSFGMWNNVFDKDDVDGEEIIKIKYKEREKVGSMKVFGIKNERKEPRHDNGVLLPF